jgi:hypothetical protein
MRDNAPFWVSFFSVSEGSLQGKHASIGTEGDTGIPMQHREETEDISF